MTPDKVVFGSTLDLLASRVKLDGDPDVVDVGRDLFASEEFVDTAYRAYLDLMVKNWRGTTQEHFEIADVAAPYTSGLYVCGVERSIITHQYDAQNDIVPAEFAIWFDGVTEIMREIPRIPRGWKSAAHGRHFRHSTQSKDKRTEEAKVDPGICTLTPDGRIHVAVPMRNGEWQPGIGLPLKRLFASIAVNLFCDRRHLWQVETSEPTIIDRPTRLSVGVSPEHVKSLFYARTLPVTESGRKRPILHWVRAHQRRLAEGIEIDVSKHLRGSDAFEMGGFSWQITNPLKDRKE